MKEELEVKVKLASLDFAGNKVELEEYCETCKGTGVNPLYNKSKNNKSKKGFFLFLVDKHPESRDCHDCNGSGTHLTPNGEQLIKFVFNNLGIAGTSSISIWQVPSRSRK